MCRLPDSKRRTSKHTRALSIDRVLIEQLGSAFVGVVAKQWRMDDSSTLGVCECKRGRVVLAPLFILPRDSQKRRLVLDTNRLSVKMNELKLLGTSANFFEDGCDV
jgi:hypothetical protein